MEKHIAPVPLAEPCPVVDVVVPVVDVVVIDKQLFLGGLSNGSSNLSSLIGSSHNAHNECVLWRYCM